ncbi:MAG: hypothetical protein H7327_08270 [Herminiimonas sp.]|nr:hypothetical protein [Herminiimonas sp.]
MNDELSNDEFDALRQIGAGHQPGRQSACVARNTKRLAGLKYISYSKDGSLSVTDKARTMLFIRDCIDGLRAVAGDAMAPLGNDVKTFLGKKGHIVPRAEGGGFELTVRGRESLADIDKSAS